MWNSICSSNHWQMMTMLASVLVNIYCWLKHVFYLCALTRTHSFIFHLLWKQKGVKAYTVLFLSFSLFLLKIQSHRRRIGSERKCHHISGQQKIGPMWPLPFVCSLTLKNLRCLHVSVLMQHYIHMHAFPFHHREDFGARAPLDGTISRWTMIDLGVFGGSHACTSPGLLISVHGMGAERRR